MSRHEQPPGAESISEILAKARTYLLRVTPAQLLDELDSRPSVTHLVDIRPAAQRAAEGEFASYAPSGSLGLPGSGLQVHVIERNVLEWRLDPQSDARLQDIVDPAGYATRVVVACSEGYTSSLAARELQRLGLTNATDLEGGFSAWKKKHVGGE